MTITDSTTPARSQRPQRRRRKLVQPRRRQRLLITRRRASSRLRVPHAAEALNYLMAKADIFKVGRRHYLVAPCDAELINILIVAAGAEEDAEPDHDREPSLAGINADWSQGVNDDDCEGDPCDEGEPDYESSPGAPELWTPSSSAFASRGGAA